MSIAHCFLKNPFEFPRQQKDDKVIHSELMKFKASQKLLKPNQSSKMIEQSSQSFKENVCLFRMADNSFICVDIFDLDLPEDQFWELQPGADYTVPNVGLCKFVVSGTQDFLDQRIRNETAAMDETEQLSNVISKKRKAEAELSSSPISVERVCEILIDKVDELSGTVIALTGRIEKVESELRHTKKEMTALKGKKNSREPDAMVVEAAIVEIDGVEHNVMDISKLEFNNLLRIYRQGLGSFPELWQNGERDRLIEVAEPLLLDLCQTGKYGQFVTVLTGFLINEAAFSISFLPPMTLHLRRSRPSQHKRTLNEQFQQAFKFYALYFGGCVLKSSVQTQWIENLREKFNVKVQNYKTSGKGFLNSEKMNPYFNAQNSF